MITIIEMAKNGWSDDAAILKKFSIVKQIGSGNYARVYKVIANSGRELAVKAINLSKTSDHYKQKFLPRELTILRRISHPNICKIHEIMQITDRVFVVMQYCAFGTIADLMLKMGPLTEQVSRYIFGPTVEAVAYLHSIDIAHRDLKVENVLLDSDYSPKLTDFSYAIDTGKLNTHTETFCGTLPYLSPEVISLHVYDAKKTDIWSLGICLFVMLNDKLPFPFEDVKQMVMKQGNREYKFRTNIKVSEQAQDLVASALNPDFKKRVSCKDILKHPWLSGPREKPTKSSPEK